MTSPLLSIVVPVLDEATQIEATLTALQPMRRRGVEVIVVDGGSQDETVALARPLADVLVGAARGRARQMNAGAALAQGEVLLFLHADTRLPPKADQQVLRNMAGHNQWGRFYVSLVARPPMLCIVAFLMTQRSKLTGIATGDQAMFVRRKVFERLGGFANQPLMEDIELSRRLLRLSAPVCLPQRVATSGRRWETRGVWRTIFLMWRLRWRYWRGESAEQLAKAYR